MHQQAIIPRSCPSGVKPRLAARMYGIARRTAPSLRCSAQASSEHGLRGCRITGSGSSVPEAVLSNSDLEKLVETNDEWIATRTGIRSRHVMAAGESLSSHAAAAANRALEMAGVSAADIDVVLLATSTPDDLFGSACQVCTGCPSQHFCLCFERVRIAGLPSMHVDCVPQLVHAAVTVLSLNMIMHGRIDEPVHEAVDMGNVQVQHIIGAKKAIAFDLTAACSGFVLGLVTAAQFVRTGAYSNILVIGADALSRYVDWRDRGECS